LVWINSQDGQRVEQADPAELGRVGPDREQVAVA
jgi:hypothetical protein